MEKQIKEIANIMCRRCPNKCDDTSGCIVEDYADAIYNAGYRKQEWISVEERLPKKSGSYFVRVQNGLLVAIHYSAKHEAFNASDFSDRCDFAIPVTHWMPLPEPPKGDNNDS
jgi:hypothetical protein